MILVELAGITVHINEIICITAIVEFPLNTIVFMQGPGFHTNKVNSRYLYPAINKIGWY
jgi:hypothetical protein